MAIAKIIVVANWKMNPATFQEAKHLFDVTRKAAERTASASLIIAPPAIFLRELHARYRGKQLAFAAQNAHPATGGAFTGEISIAQARDAGAGYILIGHSERRTMGETNDDTRKKVSAALALRMTPILCVGEANRASSGEHYNFIAEQLRTGLSDVAPAKLPKVLIAYEPVWAIGGEITMSPHDAHSMVIFIKKTIVGMFGPVGHRVQILYGGSIGEKNAPSMMREGGVQGLLVGHVSTNAERFIALLGSIGNL